MGKRRRKYRSKDEKEEEEPVESKLASNMQYGPTEFALDPNLAEDSVPFQANEAFDRASHASDMIITSTTNVPFDFLTSAIPRIDQKMQPAMQKWAYININKQLLAIAREIEASGDQDKDKELEPLEMTSKYYPTVKAYLELMPEEQRNMPVIRELAVMMDKYMFNTPLEEKQNLLNMAAAYQLPPEECKQEVN